MANEDHLAILKKGVENWNNWRLKNPHIKPDLSKAELNDENLVDVNFRVTNLNGTMLVWANLSGANLSRASLIGTNFTWANLSRTNLTQVSLMYANLSGSNLSGANLSNTYLAELDFERLDLSGANLSGANLRRIKAFETKFDGAILTGACIEDWQINHASLDNVVCEYVYLVQTEEEELFEYSNRCPSNLGKFASGEFSKLFRADRSYSNLAVLDQLINRFEKLLDDFPEGNESIFHNFLKENPILLDIYVSQKDIVSKPRFYYPPEDSLLGKKYVEPDFIIKYVGNEYKLVELERPGKRIATKQGQPTSGVTQAAFQICEWNEYICNHIDRIRDEYPGIANNRSYLVVIGRRDEKSIGVKRDPARYMGSINAQSLYTICTYDDLLDRAKQAHSALIALSI